MKIPAKIHIMTFKRILIIVFITLTAFSVSKATGISGKFISNLYGYQTSSAAGGEENHLKLYQGFLFNARPWDDRRLNFHVFLRGADDFSSEFDEQSRLRVYQLLIEGRRIKNILDYKFGRQFVTLAPVSFSLDGLRIGVKVGKLVKLTAYGGTEVPYSREAVVREWKNSKVIGLRIGSKAVKNYRIGISYLRKERRKEISWHIAGLDLYRRFGKIGSIFIRGDYNIEEGGIRKTVLRATFRPTSRLLLYSSHGFLAPRTLSNSYFRNFELKEVNIFRFGGRYIFQSYPDVDFSIFYLGTGEDSSIRFNLSISTEWAVIGYSIKGGHGGKQNQFYGGLNYSLSGKLNLFADINYSNYIIAEDLEERDISLSTALRVIYRPLRDIQTMVEIQQMKNPEYKQDFRVLARFIYSFRL
ncbi:MAG: hypothetical protein ACE5QV_01970 [Fidelibacterota bacterium]